MKTTDKDIQVLEAMRDRKRPICRDCADEDGWCPNLQKPCGFDSALSNILSDFRDMREMLEAADEYDIAFNGVGEIRKMRMFSTILARRFGNPDIKTEHASALDAWREVKGEK